MIKVPNDHDKTGIQKNDGWSSMQFIHKCIRDTQSKENRGKLIGNMYDKEIDFDQVMRADPCAWA